MNVTQEKVFTSVAKDVIDSCFEGYNGTIFAYGQTASGKTFTITGGAERYEDRGMIPRTLSYIFNEIRQKTDTSYKVLISYLEIYNDQGYDLLDENHSSKNLYDLPKVLMFENEFGQFVLKNLSIHRAESEEDALNLLFIGDTNRVVSETPMNDASTRSHCIFIIQLEAQKPGDDVKKVSKLQLVDLSGSERVSKSGVDGKTLNEAKNINLSLHYLQQVIVNLNKKMRGENVHVGYRNNTMTMMLRDSIGGNCKTKMIATIHAKAAHLGESLDTCQFSRRVSLIENSAKVNQVSDPAVIINALRKQISELKAEICLLKGTDDVSDTLTPEDIDDCNKMVEQYIKNTDPSATIVLTDRLKINQCFYQFKTLYKNVERRAKGEGKGVPLDDSDEENKGASKGSNSGEVTALKDFVSKLQQEIKRRDNEITILVQHINKKKGASDSIPVTTAEEDDDLTSGRKMTFYQMMMNKKENGENYEEAKTVETYETGPTEAVFSTKTTTDRVKEILKTDNNLIKEVKLDKEDLVDKAKAFEKFRKSYRKNQAMEENKQILKEKMVEGKNTGIDAKNVKDRMKIITSKIEELRREKAMKGMVDGDGNIMKSEEEDELQDELQILKKQYQEKYVALKEFKAEIDRLRHQIDRAWNQLQKDFEDWYKMYAKNEAKSPLDMTSDKQVQDDLKAFYQARDKIHGLK